MDKVCYAQALLSAIFLGIKLYLTDNQLESRHLAVPLIIAMANTKKIAKL
jgi:hypothetical protein